MDESIFRYYNIDTMFNGMDKHSIDSVQGMDENGVVKHLQIWMNI
jgi:hypothetical protein